MTDRWFSQKWIFDIAIRTIGVEPFTGGSLTRGYEAIGNDILEESHEITSRVKKFSDITRETKRIASRRETFAKEAETRGQAVAARENYFVASVMYGCARWPIWDDEDSELLELTDKVSHCYSKYMSFSDHRIERFEIPFEGKRLFAYLHLPPQKYGDEETNQRNRTPCVVVIPGMDTFKEELVRMYNDKFLVRGMAVMVLDGPGQGESLAKGLKLTNTNFDRAGKTIMDFLLETSKKSSSGIIEDRISIFAASFGTYWGPRIMAYDSRYFAGAFSNICHEPHMRTIFNGTLPSFKERHMWMTGIDDEKEFDEKYCGGLALDGIGEKIATQSIFIAAGSEDPLSPIGFTYDFFDKIASPKKVLFVYEGEEHRISDPLLPGRLGDFIDDANHRREIKTGTFFLERGSGWLNPKPINTTKTKV